MFYVNFFNIKWFFLCSCQSKSCLSLYDMFNCFKADYLIMFIQQSDFTVLWFETKYCPISILRVPRTSETSTWVSGLLCFCHGWLLPGILPGFYRPAKILLDMAKMAKTLALKITTKITYKYACHASLFFQCVIESKL